MHHWKQTLGVSLEGKAALSLATDVCPGSEAKGVHIAPWATVSVWGELEATPHFPVAFRIDCRNQSGNSIKLSEANK